MCLSHRNGSFLSPYSVVMNHRTYTHPPHTFQHSRVERHCFFETNQKKVGKQPKFWHILSANFFAFLLPAGEWFRQVNSGQYLKSLLNATLENQMVDANAGHEVELAPSGMLPPPAPRDSKAAIWWLVCAVFWYYVSLQERMVEVRKSNLRNFGLCFDGFSKISHCGPAAPSKQS